MPKGVYQRKHPRLDCTRNCEECDMSFTRKHREGYPPQRFCGMHCAAIYRARIMVRARFGDDAQIESTLWQLYWKERKSTVQVGLLFGVPWGTVRGWLKRFGIPVRRKGNTILLTCRKDGCREPIHRLTHAGNRASYGRLCKRHFRQHRAALKRFYKSSAYPGISEEERWLRKAKETLIRTRKLCRSQ